tara:strand:+ start:119 stop:346 length:228 start_codon:yes stop_codon:yes gene_type:complete
MGFLETLGVYAAALFLLVWGYVSMVAITLLWPWLAVVVIIVSGLLLFLGEFKWWLILPLLAGFGHLFVSGPLLGG